MKSFVDEKIKRLKDGQIEKKNIMAYLFNDFH